jgi:hypothetical protein
VDFTRYRKQLLEQRQGEIALWQLVRNTAMVFIRRNFFVLVEG